MFLYLDHLEQVHTEISDRHLSHELPCIATLVWLLKDFFTCNDLQLSICKRVFTIVYGAMVALCGIVWFAGPRVSNVGVYRSQRRSFSREMPSSNRLLLGSWAGPRFAQSGLFACVVAGVVHAPFFPPFNPARHAGSKPAIRLPSRSRDRIRQARSCRDNTR